MSILEKYRPIPEWAWMHYIIRDMIMKDQVGAGMKIAVPRCDKYSPYATSEPAIWLRDVQKVLGEHIEHFPNGSNADIQKWLDDLITLLGINKKQREDQG